MDWPVFLAVGIFLGGLVEAFRCSLWPERVAVAAVTGGLAPALFWAASSGWIWAIVALAVLGWLAWCALHLILALLA